MWKSESIGELAKALAAAQGEIRGYREDSENPFFNSKYGDLSSVCAALREPFKKNGLSYSQLFEPCDPPNISVRTILMHTSGEWISGVITMKPDKAGCQPAGSATTYARRYSLAAIGGLAPEDDDGNDATSRGDSKGSKPTTAPDGSTPSTGPQTDRMKRFVAIKEKALSIGWTEAQLRANAKACGIEKGGNWGDKELDSLEKVVGAAKVKVEEL